MAASISRLAGTCHHAKTRCSISMRQLYYYLERRVGFILVMLCIFDVWLVHFDCIWYLSLVPVNLEKSFSLKRISHFFILKWISLSWHGQHVIHLLASFRIQVCFIGMELSRSGKCAEEKFRTRLAIACHLPAKWSESHELFKME